MLKSSWSTQISGPKVLATALSLLKGFKAGSPRPVTAAPKLPIVTQRDAAWPLVSGFPFIINSHFPFVA